MNLFMAILVSTTLLVEEPRHEYDKLVEGACRASEDSDTLLKTGTQQAWRSCEPVRTGIVRARLRDPDLEIESSEGDDTESRISTPFR
jgi:hypothetical protein